ncbi:hypothetical protein [Paraburkholderia sp. BCC1885]|uniref:hypothetical protein n=1 Tax=Paraburkholderia sp. BCC1885 TaxID=2562669 RepID=UPI001182BB2F|nr:hypothetical protein [Paraburkholderia sp. BCC1885]
MTETIDIEVPCVADLPPGYTADCVISVPVDDQNQIILPVKATVKYFRVFKIGDSSPLATDISLFVALTKAEAHILKATETKAGAGWKPPGGRL